MCLKISCFIYADIGHVHRITQVIDDRQLLV